MIPPYDDCPADIKESLRAYISGRPTGDFLRAVLENDLIEAVCRADGANTWLIPPIVGFMLAEVHPSIRGSVHAVDRHLVGPLEYERTNLQDVESAGDTEDTP